MDANALPLPAGTRALLLAFLTSAYPPGSAQARLGDAPDGAIAWQVQSALDDYADFAARHAFPANDDFNATNDNLKMEDVA